MGDENAFTFADVGTHDVGKLDKVLVVLLCQVKHVQIEKFFQRENM